MTYAGNRLCFDADSHLMETTDWLHQYASKAESDLIPTLDPKNAGVGVAERMADALARRADPDATAKLIEDPLISGPKGWAAYGALDGEERGRALDLLGFGKQLVFPTFSLDQFAHFGDEDQEYAGSYALNRGMAEFGSKDERILSVGYLPLRDPDRSMAVLDEFIDSDISAFWVKSDAPGEISPSHTSLFPIWQRLADADIPIALHIGGYISKNKEYHNNGLKKPKDFLGGGENVRSRDLHVAAHSPQNFLAAMIFDGVFEKLPNLRCGVVELGASWVPGFVRQLDQAFNVFRKSEPVLETLSLKPSEYVRRQVRFTLFYFEDAGWLIKQAGDELFMFASDYPHPEGGKDPIGSFEKSMAEHGIGPDQQTAFFSGNFSTLMNLGG